MWWTMVTALLVSGEGDGVVRDAMVLNQAEVARRAATASTAAERAEREREEARARADGIDVAFLPRLGLTARYTRLSEEEPGVIDPGIPGVTVSIPAAQPDHWSFGVALVLPVSDWFLRAGDAREAGVRGVEAATHRAESERRRAALEAVLVYWSWVRASEAGAVAEASIADAKARLAETDKRAAAQVASPADVKLAEARVAEAQRARAELAHTRALLEVQLRTMLDLPRGQAIAIGEVARPSVGGAMAIEEMIAEAWRARPEPRALVEAEAAYRAELGQTGAGRLPRLDVVAGAQLVNPNPRAFPQEDELSATWDVSAVLSWQLDGLWTTGPVEEQVRARLRALAADRRALEDGIELELALAHRALADAVSLGTTSAAMLAAAEEGHRVRTRLYALGQATTLEVAEAETQLERARLGVVDARIAQRIGEARLAYALGREL